MNRSQIDSILQIISNIENFDIDKIPEIIFKDQDITIINIGQYTVADYIVTLKRMSKQFKNELSNNGIYLPFQYNFQNEFGAGNLQTDLQSLLNLINAKNHSELNTSVSYLNRLIYYQLLNGFWDKSKIKIHNADEIKLSELNEKLQIIEEQLSLNQKNFTNQVNSLNDEKKNLESFIAQKTQDFLQITDYLKSSNLNTNQINQLLNTSIATNEKINAILNQQDQNLLAQNKKAETQDSYFVKQKEIFGNFEVNLNEKVKTLESKMAEFDEKLQFVEDKKAFFEERNNYLQNLIGREVGVSLFETFKQRKIELDKPVKKWFWVVISMSILAFFAIIAVFTNGWGLLGEITKELTTIQLIINTIKTFPFLFLLFYSVSQYNKERNFQEEYAFKSAVALTIKAYADIIKTENLKDEIIISSVKAVYEAPSANKKQNTKETNAIFETSKELLETALNVLKKK